MYEQPKYLSSGERCLVVEFADTIDRDANIRLQDLRRKLDGQAIPSIREMVPTYGSLAIHYDPFILNRSGLISLVETALGSLAAAESSEKRILILPVSYGGKHGPDMETVVRHTQLSEDEVIRRHTSRDCYCFMLGFTPGFGYLGGMDETLETPRLATPRTLITAGSVGIAGKQTGAYSIDSPGGWQLIGHTPVKLFDPNAENPTIIEAGDWIRFRAVDEKEYERIASMVGERRYTPERIVVGGPA